MYLPKEILSMKEPYELFKSDNEDIRKEYIELMKIYHQDLHYNSKLYIDVCSKINELYNKALQECNEGIRIENNLVKLKGTDGKSYSMKYNICHSFELGEMYIGSNTVMYVLQKEYDYLNYNYIEKLKSIKYANKCMKEEFIKYIPKIIKKINTKEKSILIIEKSKDLYSLREVLNFYNKKIPSRHVAWILNSLYNIACFIKFNNLNHNGITIDNYFISPKNHYGALLGGWWYTTYKNEEMQGVCKDVYDVMSDYIKESKVSNTTLDLECIKLIGRTILGDKTGINLLLDNSIPKELTLWVRGACSNNPYKEYENYNKILDSAFGKRKFIEMKIENLGGN